MGGGKGKETGKGKGKGKGKEKGKEKGGKGKDEARPVQSGGSSVKDEARPVQSQAMEAHMGPYEVPPGTVVPEDLRKEILRRTGVRVACRARQSWKKKGMTLAGPPENLQTALAMVARAMPELGMAAERPDPPTAALQSGSTERPDPSWNWSAAWWWWSQGYQWGASSSASSWSWQEYGSDEPGRWRWRNPEPLFVFFVPIGLRV